MALYSLPLAFAAIAAAQVAIDANGVRGGGVRIDASGVHTGATDIEASGVHAGRSRRSR